MRKISLYLTVIATLAVSVIFTSANTTNAASATTYTLDADFDKGNLINVIHTPSDQLQLTNQVEAFNFIWVANSGEGTIVKINTDTGEIVGEFRTSPNGTYGNPSRTTVDKDGSVWVGNRQAVSGNNSAITHVGLIENGQCEDRNGNNIIETSTGLNDVKDWTDASGTRGVATAQDECIVHFTPIGSYDARHISVDSGNNVWVSGINNRTFFYVLGGKYNIPNSGSIIRTESGIGYGGYGGLISGDIIWSANPLLRWDTNYPLSDVIHRDTYNHDSYGLCEDNQGNIWNTSLSGGVIRKFSPAGDLLGTYSYGASNAQGCVVDKNNHVWVAHSLWGNSVGHLLNDGTLVGVIPVGNGPTGVAVDHNGKIWVTHYSSPYTVKRIDPSLGGIGGGGATIGAVDYTSVDLGGSLYNYSDMTGSTLSGKATNGNWTFIYDTAISGPIGQFINWTADVPNDGVLGVTIALSDDGINYGIPENVTNGQDISVMIAKFYKIVVSFERGARGISPILYDLSLATPANLMPAELEITKDVDLAKASTGDTLNYSVVVKNTGEESAIDVVIKDVLPAGLIYQDGTSEKEWLYDVILPDESKTINYVVIIKNDAVAKDYVNVASVTASGLEMVEDNATTTVSTPIVLGEETSPLLTVNKTANVSFANPGSTITYTVVVTNIGDGIAMNTVLIDHIVTGMNFTDTLAPTHTWLLGDIAPGKSVTTTYDVKISNSSKVGIYTNTAEVWASGVSNIFDTADVEIRAVAVLGAETLPVTGGGYTMILIYLIGAGLVTIFSGYVLKLTVANK